MPIYEFICSECSTEFDKLTSFDWKSAGITCPNCGSSKLDRLVSQVGFKSGGRMQTVGADACTTCSDHSVTQISVKRLGTRVRIPLDPVGYAGSDQFGAYGIRVVGWQIEFAVTQMKRINTLVQQIFEFHGYARWRT